MTVQREDRRRVEALSLSERVAIESRVWDAIIRQRRARGLPPMGGRIAPGTPIPAELQQSFPHPRAFWVGRSTARCWEYEYLAPLRNKVVLQIGGAAEHVIKFTLAGAARGFCVDPSFETVQLGRDRAELHGLARGITCLRAIGERLPFPADFFDTIYAGSVLHHTLVNESGSEIRRVLKPGGRASFHDPLEGNVLARLARKFLPYPGKGDEGVDYPLRYVVAHEFVRLFSHGECREFGLFGTPMKLLMRLHPGFRHLARALHSADDYLVAHCPPLRRFCQGISIRVEK